MIASVEPSGVAAMTDALVWAAFVAGNVSIVVMVLSMALSYFALVNWWPRLALFAFSVWLISVAVTFAAGVALVTDMLAVRP